MVMGQLFYLNNVCKHIKKSILFKMNVGLFGQNYRGATLSEQITNNHGASHGVAKGIL